MIFVECFPDINLVQTLRRISRRDIVHEFKGKGAVCNELRKKANCLALLDEDHGNPQPPYLKEVQLHSHLTDQDIKILYDHARNNSVVLLIPSLEFWILRAARLADLRVIDYGLPNDGKELHRIIKGKLDKYQSLLDDLVEKHSSMLSSLRKALGT
ncbi:MAG: hypothetical protein V1894_07425 [Chloroflexota bacterium]